MSHIGGLKLLIAIGLIVLDSATVQVILIISGISMMTVVLIVSRI